MNIVAQRGMVGGALAFHPDGNLLATVYPDGWVAFVGYWDATSGDELRSVSLSAELGRTVAIQFDGRGDHLVVANRDVYVLSLRTGEVVTRWRDDGADQDGSDVAAISSDGEFVASARRGRITVRARATGDVIRTIDAFEFWSQLRGVRKLTFSRDGSRIAATSNADTSAFTDPAPRDPVEAETRVFDTRTGERIMSVATGHAYALGLGARGEFVVLGARDLRAIAWDLDTGTSRVLGELAAPLAHAAITVADGDCWAVTVAPPATGSAKPNVVDIWDLAAPDSRRVSQFELQLTGGGASGLAASARSQRLAFANFGLLLYDVSGTKLLERSERGGPVFDVRASPDGRWLAFANHFVDLLDPAGPRLGSPPPMSRLFGFTRDGTKACGVVDKTVMIVDLAGERRTELLAPPTPETPMVLAMSDDGGSVFALMVRQPLSLWKPPQQEWKRIEGVEWKGDTRLRWEPGGHRLLVDQTANVFIVDPSDGSVQRFALEVGPAGVGRTIWSARGEIAAVMNLGNERTPVLVTAALASDASPRQLVLPPGHVDDVHVTEDGKRLIASSIGCLHIVDRSTLTLERTISGELVAISPDSTELVVRRRAAGTFLSTLGPCYRYSLAEGIERPAPDDLGRLTFILRSRFLIDQRDSVLKLRTADGFDEHATLFVLDDDWAVTTSAGQFDGTPGGWKNLYLRFGDELTAIAPLDHFFADFFEPDLLARVWRGAGPPIRRDIEAVDRNAPHVALRCLSTNAGDRGEIELEVTASESVAGSGARDLRLSRNGVLIRTWRGDLVAAGGTFRARVQCGYFDTRFSAYAFNRDNVKSREAELWTRAETTEFTDEITVVGIGIDRYAKPGHDLRYAAADARTFCSGLAQSFAKVRKHGFMTVQTYNRVRTLALTDESATKSAILGVLATLAGTASETADLRRTGPDSIVFLLFAGHGSRVGDRFYLIPHDHDWNDLEGATAISDRELADALEPIDARMIVLIVDACHSGAALDSEETRRGLLNARGLAHLAFEKGIVVLSASQRDQVAIEDTHLGHGILTHALLIEGVERGLADSNTVDGITYLIEWLEYAQRRVPALYDSTARARDTRHRSRSAASQTPLLYVPPQARAPTPPDRPLVVAWHREPDAKR